MKPRTTPAKRPRQDKTAHSESERKRRDKKNDAMSQLVTGVYQGNLSQQATINLLFKHSPTICKNIRAKNPEFKDIKLPCDSGSQKKKKIKTEHKPSEEKADFVEPASSSNGQSSSSSAQAVPMQVSTPAPVQAAQPVQVAAPLQALPVPAQPQAQTMSERIHDFLASQREALPPPPRVIFGSTANMFGMLGTPVYLPSILATDQSYADPLPLPTSGLNLFDPATRSLMSSDPGPSISTPQNNGPSL